MIDTAFEIVLSDGKPFSLRDPQPEDIDIEHIAHALSHICRWTGQTKTFYSVAQHCMDTARIVPDDLALTALLHDASEAYIGDISSPLKALLEAEAPGVLRTIESRIHAAISYKFGTVYPFPKEIKDADKIAAATERRDLIHDWDRHGIEWTEDWPDPSPWRLWPETHPMTVKDMYLQRFKWLTN